MGPERTRSVENQKRRLTRHFAEFSQFTQARMIGLVTRRSLVPRGFVVEMMAAAVGRLHQTRKRHETWLVGSQGLQLGRKVVQGLDEIR